MEEVHTKNNQIVACDLELCFHLNFKTIQSSLQLTLVASVIMANEFQAQHGDWTYDVFLSFRGEDTRKNFTDHLYYALKDAGINVFRDDPELQRGEDISSGLERAIEGSKVAVIVFSERYAESGWCLEELVKIMECRRTLRQMVLPVFYNVDPSCVRKQKGEFEEAFVKHEKGKDIDKVRRWRMALTEAANVAGLGLTQNANGYEAEFIRSIVKMISKEVKSNYLFIALYPVGIESRIKLVLPHLHIGSNDDVKFVGILGIGGLGKTTIAKALYNQLHHNFEAACFLANIKQTPNQPNGLVHLQKQLLSSITNSSNINFENMDRGIVVLQESLRRKKLLLILDDVDKISQLTALATRRECFGSGSRIVITTRHRRLLNQIEVDGICSIDVMDDAEALQLFSWHAFHNSYPSETFHQLSKRVVNYCGGLPLALQVLGCFLFGRSREEWQDTLKNLKKILDDQIQIKPKITFDTHNDHTCKDIYLVNQMLDGWGSFPRIGDINRLVTSDLLRDHTQLFLPKEVRLSVLGPKVSGDQRTMPQTEYLGISFPEDSHSQTQLLLGAPHDKLHGADDNNGRSRSEKVLTNVTREMNRNKWTISCIVTVLVIAIILILYFKPRWVLSWNSCYPCLLVGF